jgi:hypothetical protein
MREGTAPDASMRIAQESAAIDATFAALAHDEEFQAESVAFAEEAVASGWEALRLAERDS